MLYFTTNGDAGYGNCCCNNVSYTNVDSNDIGEIDSNSGMYYNKKKVSFEETDTLIFGSQDQFKRNTV